MMDSKETEKRIIELEKRWRSKEKPSKLQRISVLPEHWLYEEIIDCFSDPDTELNIMVGIYRVKRRAVISGGSSPQSSEVRMIVRLSAWWTSGLTARPPAAAGTASGRCPPHRQRRYARFYGRHLYSRYIKEAANGRYIS
jgi:hypothetical protein